MPITTFPALSRFNPINDQPEVRRWPIIATALLLYSAFLLVTAPASLLAWGVARASNNVIGLDRPEGTLWYGSASAIIIKAPGVDLQRFSKATWRVSGARLFRGQLVVGISVDGSGAKGSVTLVMQPQSFQLEQSNVTLPASAIAAFFPAFQFVRARGEVTARVKEVVILKDAVLGDAEIDWINASTALGKVNPLGTYRAKAKAKDGLTTFEVITLNGVLQIAGNGTWSSANGPSFTGVARAEPAEAANLKDLLLLMGRDDGNGNYQLKYATGP